MSEAKNLLSVLRQSADPSTVAAIEELVDDAPDQALCRINVLDFSAKRSLCPPGKIFGFMEFHQIFVFIKAANNYDAS